MRVKLLSHTPDPEQVVATAARLCYAAIDLDTLEERGSQFDNAGMIDKVLAMGHYGVLEHAVYTFGIEGVSRALTHQLVRHRLASYAQQSQRYVAFDEGFAYETPPSVAARPELAARFHVEMERLSGFYKELREAGIAAEDARFVLPNAVHSRLIMTMNARELRHFFRLRCCRRAQWEIRSLALALLTRVVAVSPALFQGAGPACLSGDCPEGEMGCGAADGVRREFAAIFPPPAD